MHPVHQQAVDALAHAQSLDGDEQEQAWRDEQDAHDEWADLAGDLEVCIVCEKPSPDHAYCEQCR